MTGVQIQQLVEEFWRRAGQNEPYPRELERPVLRALPVAIVKLPRLGLQEVRDWLLKRRIHFFVSTPDRPLRACLIAVRGRGVVFLDGSESDDERRFSLAHEIAHFLCDYLYPRGQAVAALGETIFEVLDGYRQPSASERLSGILRGVPIGTYSDLLVRGEGNMVRSAATRDKEDRADLVALELLAPRSTVVEALETGISCWRSEAVVSIATQVLIETFGLPATVASRYGKMVVMERRGDGTFRDWLGV